MAERMIPNPWLLASESSIDEFFAQYRPEMAVWQSGRGNPLTALWGAMSNRDPEARVVIANRLLDDGADVSMQSSEKANLLHVLFSQKAHDVEAEAPLLRRLLEAGVDLNLHSPKWGVPLLVLIDNYSLPDRKLGPFFDVIFAQSGINWDANVGVRLGEKRTLRWLVEQVGEAEGIRPEFARRMREYLEHGPSALD